MSAFERRSPASRPARDRDHAVTRFFQIGFKRCGTTSIAAFFNRCAIPCVHHDRGRLALRMRENLANRRPPLEGYDDRYLAFTNMDFQTPTDHFDGFRQFEALLAAYGGKFILNTCPVDHWIARMLRRSDRPGWRAAQTARYGTGDPERVAACLRADWEDHHCKVRSTIAPERLLVFDIESDSPERLCDFVGVPRSRAAFYTRENPAPSAFGEFLEAMLPAPVKRAAPDRIKARAKQLLKRRGAP